MVIENTIITEEKKISNNDFNNFTECYRQIIFILILIIICLLIILPIGYTYNNKKYDTVEPNFENNFYYPTSQPSFKSNLRYI